LSACATGPELDLTIKESEHGAVYVERFSDRSFQAAHPITLSADTMARVLRGVVVQENRGFFRTLVTGKPEGVRVCKDEDVEYLAPLLVEGLTRASSDQQVGFRVVQTGAPAESMNLETAVETHIQAQGTESIDFSTAPQFTKTVNSSMASSG
jgi:hypothetical protein